MTSAAASPASESAVASQSSRLRNALAVTAVALCLRLLVCAFALNHFGAAWFFHRGTEMGFVTHSLLSGHGFGSPFGPASGPTALVAPAYPMLVAAVFRFAGEFTPRSASLLMIFNALLNTANVLLVLVLARKVASERAAVLAALIPACAPPLLWMPTIFWETSLSATLLPACLLLATQLHATSSRAQWTAAGAAFALATLVNPALLPALFVGGVLAAWNMRGRFLMKPALAVLGFVLIYAPWPIRNELALHAFIPTRTTVGFELWMGNRDGAAGYLDESRFPTFNAGELANYRALGEVGYMAQKSSRAQAWIHHHPGRFFRLTALRVLRFWCGTGTQHGSTAYAAYAGLTTWCAMLGLFALRGRIRQSRLLACLIAAMLIFPLPYYFTHAEFRYRLVLDPVLCVLSAAGIDWLLTRGR